MDEIDRIDTVHERLHQAKACVAAIDVVLLDRVTNPGGGHMTDSVLEGLSSAAWELLDQAEKAAKGWSVYPRASQEVTHG